MKNYENHEMVLKAIHKVRLELRKLDPSTFSIEIGSVLKRLTNLYACLNVVELRQIVKELKELKRGNYKKAS